MTSQFFFQQGSQKDGFLEYLKSYEFILILDQIILERCYSASDKSLRQKNWHHTISVLIKHQHVVILCFFVHLHINFKDISVRFQNNPFQQHHCLLDSESWIFLSKTANSATFIDNVFSYLLNISSHQLLVNSFFIHQHDRRYDICAHYHYSVIHKFMVDANVPYVKAIWWTIHKLMTNLFQKIVINIEMIEKIR